MLPHSDATLTTDVNGKQASLLFYVDEGKLKHSIHGGMFACVDCHTDIEGLIHDTTQENNLRVRVTLGAGYFLGCCIVNQPLHVGVAINTGKHAAVDGVLQFAFVHIQAGLFAVHVRGQRGVGVASKAVFVLGLVFGAGQTGKSEQKESKDWSKSSSGAVHMSDKMLRQKSPQ